MLTKEERKLLEDVLDALDRLFDGDSTVAEVHSLLVATAAAQRATEFATAFEAPIRQLRDLVESDALPDRKREIGLAVTDDLRQFIAEQLLQDEAENPRRRHVRRRDVPEAGGPNG